VGSHREHHRITVTVNPPSTDNSVKNHFYSRLRKGLKKANQILQAADGRLGKEFKPNVLYRIVEVAEESFKTSPNFQKEFSLFANRT
jgi:fatty-acid desaturase